MDINKFITLFADLFEDTDSSEITNNTSFRELEEWDSLIALATLNMIEKKFGVKFTFDDMKKCETVEDLYNSIISK